MHINASFFVYVFLTILPKFYVINLIEFLCSINTTISALRMFIPSFNIATFNNIFISSSFNSSSNYFNNACLFFIFDDTLKHYNFILYFIYIFSNIYPNYYIFDLLF